jgi:hypothetical protein
VLSDSEKRDLEEDMSNSFPDEGDKGYNPNMKKFKGKNP